MTESNGTNIKKPVRQLLRWLERRSEAIVLVLSTMHCTQTAGYETGGLISLETCHLIQKR